MLAALVAPEERPAVKHQNLLEAIHAPDKRSGASGPSKGPRCALQGSQCSCGGIGYRVDPVGGMARASLCQCVVSCAACLGAARVLVDGQSKPCRDPSPRRLVNLFNEAGIPARYATARYEGFRNYSGNGRDVIMRIGQWLQTVDVSAPKGLLLGGPVGVGKTYLLVAMARHLVSRGISVKFVDFHQLLGQLKAAYSKDESDETLLAPLLNVDVLVIDEMGKGRNTDWELTILDNLVMGRYNANKIIVGSTNYLLKDAPTKSQSYQFDLEQSAQRTGFAADQFESLESRVGARIYSRLVEMCDFVTLSGDDYRRKNTAAGPTHAPAPRPRA